MNRYVACHEALRMDLAQKPLAQLRAEHAALEARGNELFGHEDWSFDDLEVEDQDLLNDIRDYRLAIEIVGTLDISVVQIAKGGSHNWPEYLNSRLRDAAAMGRKDACEVILAQGGDVTDAEDAGWTPLQNAVVYGHASLIPLFLAHGANLSKIGAGSLPPMQQAVFFGKAAVVDYLHNHHGETLDQITSAGETLDQLAHRGHDNDEMVRHLMLRRSEMTAMAVDMSISVDTDAPEISSSNLTPAQQTIKAFFEDPAGCADGLSVDLFSGGRDRSITLEHISTTHRGAGDGGRAIRALSRLADQYGVTLDLEVGYDEADIDLVAWYGRHGFVWKDGFMERSPQSSAYARLADCATQADLGDSEILPAQSTRASPRSINSLAPKAATARLCTPAPPR
jgi:hypothetical protein